MDWDIYKLGAELNSYNYQEVQDGIMAILEKGSNVVLDMTGCNEVKDIMSVTGFDNFFDSFDTMEECMEKVKNL